MLGLKTNMRNRTKKFIALTCVIYFGIFQVAFAETGSDFMQKLKQEYNLSKLDYRQLDGHVQDTESRLEALQEEKITLSEQLSNLDHIISLTEAELLNVTSGVVATQNEIFTIYNEIEAKEIALEEQKSALADYLKLLYMESNSYLSVDTNGEIDAFKMLLTDESVGDGLRELKYLDLLSEAGTQLVDRLALLSDELERQKSALDYEMQRLLALEDKTVNERQQLIYQKRAKQNLLDLTFGQEQIYLQLLEQTVDEQEQMRNDIRNLSTAIAYLDEQGDDADISEFKGLLNLRTKALYDFRRSSFGSKADFDWPVDPNRGISAYFRDPGYYGVFKVHHNAVDIPAYQASPILSAADGVVYSTKDNGYGYSYIIIAHANGMMSVYGHVSGIQVTPGERVFQGGVIGLSGGMPGTKGAGYMTTGPHLHFEMLRNGTHVDPLDFLPLGTLTEEQMKGLPEKYFDDWLLDVYGSAIEAIER